MFLLSKKGDTWYKTFSDAESVKKFLTAANKSRYNYLILKIPSMQEVKFDEL